MKAFENNKIDTAYLDDLIAGKDMAQKPPTSPAIIMSDPGLVYTGDAGKTTVFSKCLNRLPFSRPDHLVVASPVKTIYHDMGVHNIIKKRGK